jgi:hypothetical protein
LAQTSIAKIFWSVYFPGQIPDRLVIAEELKRNVIDLEGHDLVVVELGHTDTDYTTCLHVPSVGLVVAGDAAYNDVHQWLVELNAQTRREWISALDTIESLNPRAVIAGHKRPGKDDSPKIIEETRQYIRNFDRLVGTTRTARELYDKMLELYPERVNPLPPLAFGAHGQTVIHPREKSKLDIVFANAGITTITPLVRITEDNYDSIFNRSVRGLLFTVQKALPLRPDGPRVGRQHYITGTELFMDGGFAQV